MWPVVAREQEQTVRTITVILMTVTLAGLAGCIKVDVDADGLVDRYAGPYMGVFDEQAAVDRARQVAAGEGADVNQYDLATRRIQKDYWVLFDRRDAAGKPRTWPYHFSVRVKPDGSAKLFKDR